LPSFLSKELLPLSFSPPSSPTDLREKRKDEPLTELSCIVLFSFPPSSPLFFFLCFSNAILILQKSECVTGDIGVATALIASASFLSPFFLPPSYLQAQIAVKPDKQEISRSRSLARVAYSPPPSPFFCPPVRAPR